jgi:hypothetical protein
LTQETEGPKGKPQVILSPRQTILIKSDNTFLPPVKIT